MNYLTLVLTGGFLVLGLALGYFLNYLVSARKSQSLEKKAAEILETAKKEGQERKNQLDRLEERLIKREEILEKHFADLQRKESNLEKE